MDNRFVFLDLEGTVISDIFEQLFCNIDTVKNWLAESDTTVVGIFSFAVDNDDERTAFRDGLAKHLEKALGVSIGRVATTEDAMKAAIVRNRVRFENLSEFVQLWGKERGFIDWTRQTFKNCTVVLLDDLVTNCEFHDFDKNLTIELVNVNSL